MTHFGSPTGAASAAPCAATDATHETRLQQLLSPGVQTVQLIHDAWNSKSLLSNAATISIVASKMYD